MTPIESLIWIALGLFTIELAILTIKISRTFHKALKTKKIENKE